MSLGMTYLPPVPRRGAANYSFDHCLHIAIVNYEVYRRFRGDFFALGLGWVAGVGYVGGSFHGGFFRKGREFP